MVDWTLNDFKDKRAIYVNLGQTLVFIRRCKISIYLFFIILSLFVLQRIQLIVILSHFKSFACHQSTGPNRQQKLVR